MNFVKRLFVALALGASLAPGPVIAQDTPRMTGLDFLIDWPDYTDQRVILTGGKIAGANIQFMLLSVKGGNITLREPWQDREDVRYLLNNCTSILTGRECEMMISGTVRASGMGGPELVDVDFLVPTKP